ncbi:alpha/beta hydrolase family protein [Streptomyces sp. NPDC021093]|uniref:alpha/beta hydrolase family protein n=1 Tax=Streptomyces sp. NPDC021093 TaxID=3365112 RepID=UPI00379D0C6D
MKQTRAATTALVTAVALAGLAAAPALAATAPTVTPAAAAIPAASAPAAQKHADRGALLSVTPLGELDRGEVAAFVAKGGVEADAQLVRYGLAAYRLTYRTVTPQGAPTTATGLFVLPKGLPKSGDRRLPIVSDTHGTMVHRDYAPSVGDDFGRLSPYLYASTGRAVAAPDYLGLGQGPGLHPYMDTKSAVTATVDMLRASRQAAKQLGRALNGDVYATGFSQGGQVAMAVGRELARGAGSTGGDRHFRLKALAPVAGPYDLSGTEIPALYDGRVNPMSGLFYTSYFLTAQNRIHPLYKDPAEVFRQPYAKVVEQLFDTRHTEEDVVKNLPGSVKELLTPAFYEEMRHPSGALLKAIEANDGTCDWKPRVPVRLHTSSGDTDVPIGNARTCAADLADNGLKAPVVDQGEVDHFGAFKKSIPQIARWFVALGR